MKPVLNQGAPRPRLVPPCHSSSPLNGATGYFVSAATLLGLAMGVARVVAVGRDDVGVRAGPRKRQVPDALRQIQGYRLVGGLRGSCNYS